MDYFHDKTVRIYINMGKIKKSVTLGTEISEMLSKMAKKLDITENSVISVALLEYYNKVKELL